METFHEGERQIQERAGVRDLVERMGRRLIRDHLIEQHRQFFELLPFVVVGVRDREGHPRVHILAGPPGFVSAEDDHHLRIQLLPGSIPHVSVGSDIALLGILPEARRRNRENGTVVQANRESLRVRVTQSYGNCPKFITPRRVRFEANGPHLVPSKSATQPSGSLDDSMQALIESSDTFFVATGYGSANEDASHGLDVSHRGGPPGFVSMADNGELAFIDFPGNNMFNTLGNLSRDARTSLVFIDFQTSRALHLKGTADVEWSEASPTQQGRAGRTIRFRPTEASWSAPLPLVFENPR